MLTTIPRFVVVATIRLPNFSSSLSNSFRAFPIPFSRRFSFCSRFRNPHFMAPPRSSSSSSSSSRISVEYAKSNRSSCKKCSNKIDKEALRLGMITRANGGYDETRWHHLDCFPVDSKPLASPDAIEGFSSLKSSDQEAIKEYFAGHDKPQEEVSKAREGLQNEQRDVDSKKRKVQEATEDIHNELQERASKQTKVDINFSASDVKNKDKDAKLLPKWKAFRISVEYAKSNRSSCKKCSNKIDKEALRLGLITKANGGYDETRWHHLHCFPLDSKPLASPEAIEGFSSLKSSDQEAIKEYFAGHDKPQEEVSKAREGLQNEQRDVDSKKRKVQEATEDIHNEPQEKASKKTKVDINFSTSDVKNKFKDAELLPKWKAFKTVIFLERDDGLRDSSKIASFDFDGCLAKTDVKRVGADFWSLMFPSIPAKLQSLYSDGYKLVIFTNESNIERWKKSRQKAVDSKIGRLNNFIDKVKVPIQVFIACGLSSKADSKEGDLFRKPKPGMWQLMERHFNSDIPIDMDQSFYVGDAAGRKQDHSDADIKFAKAIGLKFYVPEEYFGDA